MRPRLIRFALVGLTLAVFLQVRTFSFVQYDDDKFVTDNPFVRNGLTARDVAWAFEFGRTENWHPLTWLSLQLDAELWGLSSAAFHLTNVLFHVANVLLLYELLRRMTGAETASGLVAALFAIHPLHVESVAWVAERKDVLSTLFGLLALLAWVGYVNATRAADRARGRRFYWLTVALFTCSLLSKQMLVTLPFVLLLLDLWPLRRGGGRRAEGGGPEGEKVGAGAAWRQLVLEKTPFFILSAAFSVVTYLVQREGGAMTQAEKFSLPVRLMNAAIAYVLYIWKTFWPTDLAFYYPHPGENISTIDAALAAGVLAAITIWALTQVRRRPYVFVGWFWFVGTLVPVIGIVQVGGQQMADRYTYVPLIGLFIAIVWWVAGMLPVRWREMGLAIVGAPIVCVLAFVAWKQTATWESSERLFTHALEVTTGNSVAHTNLGVVLNDQGQFAEALTHFREALEIDPENWIAHDNMAIALFRLDRMQDAVAHIQASMAIAPKSPFSHSNLGTMLQSTGDLERALEQFRLAIEKQPDFAIAHSNAGAVLNALRRYDEAISHFQAALRIDPEYAAAYSNLGNALQGKKDHAAAIESYRTALAKQPDFVDAHRNLAIALESTGELESALAELRRADELSPGDVSVVTRIGALLSVLDRFDEAEQAYHRALALDRRSGQARLQLAQLLARTGKTDDAIEELTTLVGIHPTFVAAHVALGELLLGQGKVEEARKHADEALRLNRENTAALELKQKLESR